MRRQALAFGLVVAAIVGAASCRQIVGIKDSPPEDIQTSVSGLQFGTGACAACAEKSCAAMSEACSTSPPCKAYEDCVGTCKGDPKCRSQCTVDNRVGQDSTGEISALSVCLASNCEADCGLSCGGVAAYLTPPASAAECETCVASDCGAENTCARSIDCDAYVRCLLACPTPDCQQACASTRSDGYTLYGQFDAIHKTTCATACAYGNDCASGTLRLRRRSRRTQRSSSSGSTNTPPSTRGWSRSRGSRSPSAATSGTGPISPVALRSCPPTPMNATDASGGVTIPAVPIAMSLDRTGFMGFGRLQRDGYMDSWFFWGFPLSEPSVTWGEPFTPALFLDQLPSTPQVGTGNAWVVSFDCLGLLAGGVHVKTGGSDMEPDYFHYPPDDTGTYANVPGSGAPGIAEYGNLPVGVYRFRAYPKGATTPSSVVIANVFDGADSLVALFPNQ